MGECINLNGAGFNSDETPTPADVLAFWRAAGSAKWFRKDEAFDARSRHAFLRAARPPPRAPLAQWETTPERAGAPHPAQPVSAQYLSRQRARLRG
jgi:hypothetical protein